LNADPIPVRPKVDANLQRSLHHYPLIGRERPHSDATHPSLLRMSPTLIGVTGRGVRDYLALRPALGGSLLAPDGATSPRKRKAIMDYYNAR